MVPVLQVGLTAPLLINTWACSVPYCCQYSVLNILGRGFIWSGMSRKTSPGVRHGWSQACSSGTKGALSLWVTPSDLSLAGQSPGSLSTLPHPGTEEIESQVSFCLGGNWGCEWDRKFPEATLPTYEVGVLTGIHRHRCFSCQSCLPGALASDSSSQSGYAPSCSHSLGKSHISIYKTQGTPSLSALQKHRRQTLSSCSMHWREQDSARSYFRVLWLLCKNS